MSTQRLSDQPRSDSGPPVDALNAPARENDFSLLEIVAALWKQKWVIIAIIFVFALASIAYVLLVTPIFRSEVVLAPSDQEQGANIPSGLGGIAGIAGLTLGSSVGSEEKLATLRSRAFVEEFIDEENLLPILFSDQWDSKNEGWTAEDSEAWPDIRDGVEFFVEHVRSVDDDPGTGLIILSIEWTDAQLAASWAESLVFRINERLRTRDLVDSKRRLSYLNTQLGQANLIEMRQAISRLIESEIQTIMLAQAESEYAFKVIDPPRVSKEQVSPNRKLIVILATLIGGMIGVIVALGRWAIGNLPRNWLGNHHPHD